MSRAGSRGSSRSATVVAFAAFVLFAAGVEAAQNGAGIWVYKCDWSNSIVNLTNYTLKVVSYDVDSDGCYAGNQQATTEWLPFDLPITAVKQVDPFGTWQFGVAFGCDGDPYSYEGTVTFGFDGSYLADSQFKIVFKRQGAAGVVSDKKGTWVGLSPYSSTQAWYAADTHSRYGQYSTPLNDNKMHNLMTLVGPKLMVALYSWNNKDVVLVVQQLKEDADGWDDSGKYYAWAVDYIDNSGDSVPGQ